MVLRLEPVNIEGPRDMGMAVIENQVVRFLLVFGVGQRYSLFIECFVSNGQGGVLVRHAKCEFIEIDCVRAGKVE